MELVLNIDSIRFFLHQSLAPLPTTTTRFEVQPSDAVQLGAPSHSFFLGRVQLSPIERKVHATPIYGHNRSTSTSLHQSSYGIELGMICQEIFHNCLLTFVIELSVTF